MQIITEDAPVDTPIMSKRKARACTPSDTEEAELFHTLAKCKGATPTLLAIIA